MQQSTLFQLMSLWADPFSSIGSEGSEAYREFTWSEKIIGQNSAKLHCLYGRPFHGFFKRHVHPFARARVYDLRNYTTKTMWGPFRDDGSGDVDWEKMEAIMIIVDHNFILWKQTISLQEVLASWPTPWRGITPNSFKQNPNCTIKMDPKEGLDLEDPYNITGTWLRVSTSSTTLQTLLINGRSYAF